METLHRKSEPGKTWYAVSVERLDSLIIKVVSQGSGYPHPYALRRNLCYNLQYLEYVANTIDQLKMSGVILTQSWKTFIVTGCGIVESLLKYLLITLDEHSRTEWQLRYVSPGSEKTIDGKRQKIDSHVYTKLANSVLTEMSFDGMLGRAKAKKVLGMRDEVYQGLDKLRKLRNRVHLQRIEHEADHDWNAFNIADYQAMRDVIYEIFTSTTFRPTAEEREYFAYLR